MVEFCGKCKDTGKMVIGNLLVLSDEWFIIQQTSYKAPYEASSYYHTIQIYPNKTKKEHILAYPVDPDTVEQLDNRYEHAFNRLKNMSDTELMEKMKRVDENE